MRKKIASTANYLAAALLMSFGLVYLTKASFMPYHSEAVSLEWEAIEQEFHILILALMRAVGGGFVAASISIIVLQYHFDKNRIKWIPLLILLVGTIISATSIYATAIVRLNTPGNPPTSVAIFGLILIIIGYLLNRTSR